MKDGQPLIRELGTCGALQKCSHYYLRRLDNSGWPESVIIRKGGEVPREDVPEDCPYPVSCIPYPGGNGRRVTRPGQASHREARNYSRRCRAARASGPRQRGSRRPKRKGRLRKDITKVNAGPRARPPSPLPQTPSAVPSNSVIADRRQPEPGPLAFPQKFSKRKRKLLARRRAPIPATGAPDPIGPSDPIAG
jgi:hypothetical protein